MPWVLHRIKTVVADSCVVLPSFPACSGIKFGPYPQTPTRSRCARRHQRETLTRRIEQRFEQIVVCVCVCSQLSGWIFFFRMFHPSWHQTTMISPSFSPQKTWLRHREHREYQLTPRHRGNMWQRHRSVPSWWPRISTRHWSAVVTRARESKRTGKSPKVPGFSNRNVMVIFQWSLKCLPGAISG